MSNIDAVIRQLKIDLITGEHNPIIDWFNDLWSQVHVFKTNVHYKNEDEIIYYTIDPVTNKTKTLFLLCISPNSNFCSISCNSEYYWKILRNKFSNKNDADHKLADITKLLLEHTNEDIKIDHIAPFFQKSITWGRTEELLANI